MSRVRILKLIVTVGLPAALIGCHSAPVSYTRIGAGPDLEYALARCEIAASSTEQGMFAMGSAGYVLGA